MPDQTLLTGPRYPALEATAFADLGGRVQQPNSVYYSLFVSRSLSRASRSSPASCPAC
jgi:hypothetical protein